MTCESFFKDAKWLGAAERRAEDFFVLRSKFSLSDFRRVTANVLGLGFFKCYVNGICINPDTFLPLSSDYEGGCDPEGEVLSGHRIYVPSFDITEFVREGENTIAIHFGGGWYTHKERTFGLPKAIYCIFYEETDGSVKTCVSDESSKIEKSYINDYGFTTHEQQNLLSFDNCFDSDFDDSKWDFATPTEALETEYLSTDCPTDKLIGTLRAREVGRGDFGIIYDCGENTTGYPVLKVFAEEGEKVTVLFSEELSADGTLDATYAHCQRFEVVSDGEERTVSPQFTWFGFRYFEIIGKALPVSVSVVHADVKISSTFECDNETLNWVYKTFMHTMLCNMHTGHPSDCPHIERLGYTGDGQLTCNAALYCFDSRAFYEKWLQDIADSQDKLSGRIQYTAPYMAAGGGPGGWGSAIIEVPYQLYKHFGDKEILRKYYENMRLFIDFLESRCEFGLVTGNKGRWSLGEWCAPYVLYPDKDVTTKNQQFIIPPAFVNTYFLVRSLIRLSEIARIIEKNEDISEYEGKAELHKRAIKAAYYNTFDGSYMNSAQGANAFAVDLGMIYRGVYSQSRDTYEGLVDYYEKVGSFDTGIFATDVLTRVLFENGDAALAVKLLISDGRQGYEMWRRGGATTFHEYWDSSRSRSHCHPMFGAPVAYFFEYLLGIRQPKESVGYRSLIIEPQGVFKFSRMSGSIQIPNGIVAVSYERNFGGIRFKITVPEGVEAVFRYGKLSESLSHGENVFNIRE